MMLIYKFDFVVCKKKLKQKSDTGNTLCTRNQP